MPDLNLEREKAKRVAVTKTLMKMEVPAALKERKRRKILTIATKMSLDLAPMVKKEALQFSMIPRLSRTSLSSLTKMAFTRLKNRSER
jgi:hypothetical protein